MTPLTTTVARMPSHAASARTVPAQAPTRKGRAYAHARKALSRYRLRTSLRSMGQCGGQSGVSACDAGPGLPLAPLRHRQLGLGLRPPLRPHHATLALEGLEGEALGGVHPRGVHLVAAEDRLHVDRGHGLAQLLVVEAARLLEGGLGHLQGAVRPAGVVVRLLVEALLV